MPAFEPEGHVGGHVWGCMRRLLISLELLTMLKCAVFLDQCKSLFSRIQKLLTALKVSTTCPGCFFKHHPVTMLIHKFQCRLLHGDAR